MQRAQVIAGLGQRVHFVGNLPFAVFALGHKMKFWFNTGLVNVAMFLADTLQIIGQNRARAVRPRFAFRMHIARDPSHVFAPRQYGQAAKVWNRHYIRAVWALPHFARSKTGEAAALAHHIFQMGGGHELGFWRATQLHKGAEKKLNPVFLNQVLGMFQRSHNTVASVKVSK